MNESEWLMGLKTGDDVFVEGRSDIGIPYKIRRTTPTLIVVEVGTGLSAYEEKFNRKSGRSLGGDAWSRKYLQMPTDELREKYELAILSRKAKRLFSETIIPKTKTELLEFIKVIESIKVPVSEKTDESC